MTRCARSWKQASLRFSPKNMTPFCQRSLDFLYFNNKYNSKAWYQEHRDDFKQYLSLPFTDLAVALAPAMLKIDGQMLTEPKSIISRLYKDLRFAKDKTSLYRDHMWLTFMRDKNVCGAPGFFFEISPYNFRFGCDYYMADAKSMASLRNLILSNSKTFQKAKKCFEQQSTFKMVGENYKKPKYPDAPQDLSVWLEKKDICFIATSFDAKLLFSENLADYLAEQFQAIKPIYDLMLTAESMTER